MNKTEVTPERIGFRDEKLSRRHRDWGLGCPVTDVDFLVVEYYKHESASLIEYKNERAPKQYAKKVNIKCKKNLAKIQEFRFLL